MRHGDVVVACHNVSYAKKELSLPG